MQHRLAVVQHGDYREALRITESGQPEPYTGMHYSVRSLEALFEGTQHLVVSLDAPSYHVRRESGELVGLSPPCWKKGSKLGWSWRAYHAVRRFRPTHVLIRTGGGIATPILQYALARGLSVLVVHAGYVTANSWRERLLNRYMVALLNDPRVFLVANHRRPAAESFIAAGVKPEKVVAYDWPARIHPSQSPARTLPAGQECHVFYAGMMKASKGIGDLVEAVTLLNRSGHLIRLTACGDGPDLADLRARAGDLPGGLITFTGQVANETVLDRMREATIVCVPSRRDSSEGFPFVITEAMACRTPLVVSDHPSFVHLLNDGEGLRVFPSGDPAALAKVICEVVDDPAAYERLSELTASAYAKIECTTFFHELLERWRAEWDPPPGSTGADPTGAARTIATDPESYSNEFILYS